MTPAARLAAVIEVLDAALPGHLPADQVLAAYLRRRRYIGAKDRRAISQRLYDLLRGLARLDWWLETAECSPTARCRALAHLVLSEGLGSDEVEALFNAGGYGPAPLSVAEAELLARLRGQSLSDPEQPQAVRAEVPAWLWPAFLEAFGAETPQELSALIPAAPLDLRVNSLKASRDEAAAALRAEGIEALPTALSPLGLRIAGRPGLHDLKPLREGWIELQDEASQVAALFCDAQPGQHVLDLCAGGGGKSLALAAAMENSGTLLLHDSDVTRLAKAKPRLRRAGVGNATFTDGTTSRLEAGQYDRVLLDAPCSGSGAWRRHPDARWRLTEADLEDRCRQQAELLAQAADLVAPGGRLIYATCSLLPAENQAQVEAFLTRRVDYSPLPIAEVSVSVLGKTTDCPAPSGANGLTLTPARNGCDGFFIAVLQRREGA